MCSKSGVDVAIEQVNALQQQIADSINDSSNGLLQPLPGQTMESCAQEVGAVSKTISASTVQFVYSSVQVQELVFVRFFSGVLFGKFSETFRVP